MKINKWAEMKMKTQMKQPKYTNKIILNRNKSCNKLN